MYGGGSGAMNVPGVRLPNADPFTIGGQRPEQRCERLFKALCSRRMGSAGICPCVRTSRRGDPTAYLSSLGLVRLPAMGPGMRTADGPAPAFKVKELTAKRKGVAVSSSQS